jgi:hypothetical protein
MVDRLRIAGDRLFDVFPDNPDDPLADGVSSLFRSLTIATETGRRHTMAVQRYDVRDPDGRFVERFWQPENTPLFDEDGRLVALLHHVEDVTGRVGAAAADDLPREPGQTSARPDRPPTPPARL